MSSQLAANLFQSGATILQTGGAIGAGNSQASNYNAMAAQLDSQAAAERASATRDASDEARNAQYLVSRGQAVAAASGAGATDPTVVNLLANISGEGEYRALTALYNGDQTARGYEAQAAAYRAAAKNSKSAGLIKGLGTILSAGSTMFDRFGGGGPGGSGGGFTMAGDAPAFGNG